MADFIKAYNKTAASEGGYSNDPDDSGGETWRGISRIKNPAWVGWEIIDQQKGAANFPALLNNILLLDAEVKRFYKSRYWDIFLGDFIPNQAIANQVYDIGVNQGTQFAAACLQNGLNVLNRNGSLYPDLVVDGDCGPRTLEALNKYLAKDKPYFLVTMLIILRGFRYFELMKQSPTQEKYARGWLDRIAPVFVE